MNKKYLISAYFALITLIVQLVIINQGSHGQYIEDTSQSLKQDSNVIENNNKIFLESELGLDKTNLYQTNNIGEDISDKILSLSLEAKNVVYSLNTIKEFTLTITNISSEIFSLNISDNYIHNVFFDIYDELNFPVPIQPSLLEERNAQYVFYRNITLYPSEFFTITVNLEDFVILNKPGVYKISARFYPSLYNDMNNTTSKYIESSRLLVSFVSITAELNNMNMYEDIAPILTNINTRTSLITRPYSPHDVVHEVMSGLMSRDWDNFFLHTDIPTLFINTVSNRSTHNLLSKEEQRKETQQFAKRIRAGKVQNDLYPPTTFIIEETRYTSNNANVQVLTKVLDEFAIQLYKYNFKLIKQNVGWKIVDYTVTYLGIESVNTEENFLGNATDYKSSVEFQ